VSRSFRSQRPIRLSDTDATGRLRLDAVARYLQDVASDDWADAGFESHAHVWVVRKTWIDVESPFADDTRVAVSTWCSGIAGTAASRRYSLTGDRGGRIEAESVWIHLSHDLRPLRLPAAFVEIYGASAAGRGVATRFTLPSPPGQQGERWPLRATDVDRLGHVNNAAYWQPLEERFTGVTRAELEYRKPIDLDDDVRVVVDGDHLWLTVRGEVRAALSTARDPVRAAHPSR
jgi:acyl-ACP thioesterase